MCLHFQPKALNKTNHQAYVYSQQEMYISNPENQHSFLVKQQDTQNLCMLVSFREMDLFLVNKLFKMYSYFLENK